MRDLVQQPVGFKGKINRCNHLNFNFLQKQDSVPVPHGIITCKHNRICCSTGSNLYTSFFNKFKSKIHGYSYVHHQALFGQVHVCPV